LNPGQREENIMNRRCTVGLVVTTALALAFCPGSAAPQQMQASSSKMFYFDPNRGASSGIPHNGLFFYYSQDNQIFTLDFGDGTSEPIGAINYLPARDCFPQTTVTPPGCLGSYTMTHTYATAGIYTAVLKDASGNPVDSLTANVP
jgi:hypothetical protein